MSNHKNRETKSAEIRQLADMCVARLNNTDPHGFGYCWRYDAAVVNKVAEVLGIPYRISDRWDRKPVLVKVGG